MTYDSRRRGYVSRYIPATWLSSRVSIAVSLAIAVSGSAVILQQRHAIGNGTQRTIRLSAYMTQPDDLRTLANQSSFVVEGTISQVYPARWTTPDGNRPANLQDMTTNPQIQLRTPVRVLVGKVFKGSNDLAASMAQDRSVLFSMPGGSDGQITVQNEDNPTPKLGATVRIFLSKAPPVAGPWVSISPIYPQMIFTVDGDILHGPQKDVPLAAFDQQIGVAQ